MSGLRVSLNEVLRLSRRVFLALGAGPGCEHEPARAVVWLESRGLPGLAMLLHDCRAARRDARVTATEIVVDAVATLRIDGGGASGAWVAAAAADWRVASGAPCTVTVNSVRSPLWFIPDVAARGGDRPGCMMARDNAGALLLAASFDEGGTSLQFWVDPGELTGSDVAVVLRSGSLPAHAPAAPHCLRPDELAARHAASLGAGIQVEGSLWHALYRVARGALVPETEASRARGAGAQGQS